MKQLKQWKAIITLGVLPLRCPNFRTQITDDGNIIETSLNNVEWTS